MTAGMDSMRVLRSLYFRPEFSRELQGFSSGNNFRLALDLVCVCSPRFLFVLDRWRRSGPLLRRPHECSHRQSTKFDAGVELITSISREFASASASGFLLLFSSNFLSEVSSFSFFLQCMFKTSEMQRE